MGSNGIYPLVNVYILLWKDPPSFIWENPLFQWPFSIAMLVHQRVFEPYIFPDLVGL